MPSASAATIRRGDDGKEGGDHRIRADIKRRPHPTDRKEDQAVQPDPSGVPMPRATWEVALEMRPWIRIIGLFPRNQLNRLGVGVFGRGCTKEA
jgi:hypothetical protein